MFKRNLEQPIIDKLQDEDLWKLLKVDCRNQEIFFAIRDNNIGFYHKGGRLFEFSKNGFKTHFKYASVIGKKAVKSDYLTANELGKCELIKDFSENYGRIKENCKLYSGVEADGVSEIYHNHSYFSKENIVVLDIEVSFETMNKTYGQTQDRIDILLLDKKTKTLKFVEAKHYGNSCIRSKTTPKVIEQIERYEEQIRDKEKVIIAAYQEYVKKIKEIFTNVSLPEPKNIDYKVALLIFGYNKDQEKGELKLIKEEIETNGCSVYSIGKTNSITDNTLANICKTQ